MASPLPLPHYRSCYKRCTSSDKETLERASRINQNHTPQTPYAHVVYGTAKEDGLRECARDPVPGCRDLLVIHVQFYQGLLLTAICLRSDVLGSRGYRELQGEVCHSVNMGGTKGRHGLIEARGSDEDSGIRKRVHEHIASGAGLKCLAPEF